MFSKIKFNFVIIFSLHFYYIFVHLLIHYVCACNYCTGVIVYIEIKSEVLLFNEFCHAQEEFLIPSS